MENERPSRYWIMSSMGLQVHDVTKYFRLMPAPDLVEHCGLQYRRWEKLQEKYRSRRAIANRFLVWPIVAIISLICCAFFVFIAAVTKMQLLSIMGGWVTFYAGLIVHDQLSDRWPVHGYNVRNRKSKRIRNGHNRIQK
jgi:uncharacterized metal-binding protein